MFTNNKIFIDSSILIEALKGNKIVFYKNLISDINNKSIISETVLSEYLYFVLGFSGGTSPRTLKENGQISETFSANENLTSILKDFSFVNNDFSILHLVPKSYGDLQPPPKRCHYFSYQ